MLGVLMEDKDAATLLDKSVVVLGAGAQVRVLWC